LKLKLVICYNYFLPAYKAGGPVQSIAHLIRNVHEVYEIFVITSNTDLGEKEPINVIPNTWQEFENGKAKVIYLSKEYANAFYIKKLIENINPAKIFVNGIYSIPFSIALAFYFPKKTIMHVRGMLHPCALAQKAFKKKFFLAGINLLGLHKKITFCVSDAKEKEFTQIIFGKNSKIAIAQNFPASFDAIEPINKNTGVLKLISIALISPMKNHALVLEALSLVKYNIIWDIYGPIKDNDYWKNCKELITQLPFNITVVYKGVIHPAQVYHTLNNYHFFILPSESENFGHALYEAMVAAKPIITSNNTPWNFLNENNAGYNVELTKESIANAIANAASLSQNEYNEKVKAVRYYAENAINREEIKEQYLTLFN
jgi:glycosyltransferase involved in cell wall biosynthesis